MFLDFYKTGAAWLSRTIYGSHVMSPICTEHENDPDQDEDDRIYFNKTRIQYCTPLHDANHLDLVQKFYT